MKKIKLYKIIVIAMIIALMSIASGCSDANSNEEKVATSTAVIIGDHSNSQPIDFTNKKLQEFVTKTYRQFGDLIVISCDGQPEVVTSMGCDVDDKYKSNPELVDELAIEEAVRRVQSFSEVRANDPEVDVLRSLEMAVDGLANVDDSSSKIIYIVDVGIQTTGLLDMKGNLLTAGSPKEIADELESRQAIPDLNNIKVYWQHLGQVAAPQSDLTPAQKNQLIEIWKEVIQRGGGQFIEVKGNPAPSQDNDDTELPEVTPIELPAEDPIEFDPEAKVDLSKPNFITEEGIKFLPDSDKFADERKVTATLTPIVEYMNSNKEFDLLIVGTTAGDNNTDFNIQLSEKRAIKVKKALVKRGISDSRIYAEGMGCTDPWHLFNAGTGDSEGAKKNRKVVLVDAESDTAKQIMGQLRN